MAGQQWSVLHSMTTEQKKLRVAIVSPVEDPSSKFLDIRRTFTKSGKLCFSKVGVRSFVDALDLKEMTSAILSIARVQRTEAEVSKLHFRRKTGLLQIRKVKKEVEQEGEEEKPPARKVCLALSVPEVKFLYESIQFLRGKLEEANVEEEESDEENEDDRTFWM